MFQQILLDMIRETSGALGAIFLDWEGETVEMVTDRPLDADDHDLKIIGAYQGIFLTQLRKLCEEIEVGRPERFKIEFARTRIFSCDLKDGYYLVLVADETTNEGIAWQHLGKCRDRLLPEI